MDYMPEKFKGMELVAEPVEKVNVTLDGIILKLNLNQMNQRADEPVRA